MKKNSNKGFIATSILFGIVALLFITFAIILGNSHASLKNDKVYGNMLKGEITNFLGVILYPNGGYVEKTKLEIDFNGTYGEKNEDGSIEELPQPTRNGYKFEGWYTAIDGGVIVQGATKYADVLANKLYAHWSKNIYTLSINPNGGTYDESTAASNYPLYFEGKKEIVNPTRVGYTFDGWELTGDGSKIDGSTFQMGYENATLKAKWKIKEVTLTVDPQMGTWEGSTDVQVFDLEYKDTKEIEDPVREGYTFTGWVKEPSNASLSGKTLTLGEENVVLTASWQINNYPYIIKHYQQGIDNDEYTLVDADTTEAEAKYDEILIIPYNEYKGFRVLGDLNDVDENGNIKPQTLTITTDISKNLVEYQYDRILYKLTINPNSGTYEGKLEEYYRYQKSIELSTPTKKGYTFTNWSVTGGTVKDNIFTIEDNATLTANWKANDYVVTLEPNGGNVENIDNKVTYDSPYGTFNEPVRTGYTFKGWSTTKDGKNIINSETIVKTASDHTLYAVWEANTYTITLYPRGGTVNPTTIKVTFDGTYKDLPTPTKNKHQFLGWFTDEVAGTEVTNDLKVTTASNQNLYARWLPTDAEFVQYSNSTYTTCDNVACALNELYSKFK